MNKKGLSMIVSTLIIILLVLVAVGVIWAVVNKIVTEGADKITLDKLFIDLKIINAVADGSNMVVTVERGVGEGDLAGMTFVFSDGENSEVQSTTDTLDQLETGTYTLELTELGTLDITSVSVAPIYLAPSGDEVLGEVTDTNEPSDNDLEGGSDDPSPPGCTPDCVDKKCGDDGCGGSCGTCDVGFVCDGTQACVEEEECVDTCSSLGYECGTFDVCGVSTECGTCSGDFETCDAVAGVCESEQILAGGVIDSIWPGSAPIYFDSNSLPKNLVEIETYRTKYINFSSLPGFCHQIFLAEYAPDGGYDMSHLGFENVISHLTTHTPEDPILFDVWETPTFCGNQ